MLDAHVSRFTADAVRRYYDTHTSAFVSLGQGGAQGAMHRAVWGPGVGSRAEAFRYVDDQIAGLIRQLASGPHSHVVDLGCGVGGSLCYLAQQLPITGAGITLSRAQAAIATGRLAAAGVSDRVEVIAGDYLGTAVTNRAADLVFAIESFVHAESPERFLAQCARLLRPGGMLVICDDFRRAPNPGTEEPRNRGTSMPAVDRYCRGWHINTLIDRQQLRDLGERFGFECEATLDLSPYVEIGRFRDRLIDIFVAPLDRLPRRWKRLDPWIGGGALQECLRRGWVGYDFAVFRYAPQGQQRAEHSASTEFP